MHFLHSNVFVICACEIFSNKDVALVDLNSSGTPKQQSLIGFNKQYGPYAHFGYGAAMNDP